MKRAKVYIQGRAFYGITADTFRNLGGGKYEIIANLPDADIVVWTGGEDISPAIYNERPIPGVYGSKARDYQDLKAVDEAVKLNKFLVGICRGAQLLNCVPNEGKLWQDVNGHNGNNHPAFDCITGQWIEVNSVHHQMMIPGPGAEILCWAKEATRRESATDVWVKPLGKAGINPLEKDKDIEVLWYPKTQSLCPQFHPEFGHPETTRYFFRLMDAYYWGKQASIAA